MKSELFKLSLPILFLLSNCARNYAVLYRPIKPPAIIFEDNGAVIAVSREMTSRAKRCKHFLMAISRIREQVEANLIRLQQISDGDNRADLTKIITDMEFLEEPQDHLGSNDNTPTLLDKSVRKDD